MKFDELIKKISEEDIDDISLEIPDFGDKKPEDELNIDALPTDKEVEELELSEVTAEEVKALIDLLTPAQLAVAKAELDEIISGEEQEEEEEEENPLATDNDEGADADIDLNAAGEE